MSNNVIQCNISLSKAEHARITWYLSLIRQLFWTGKMIEILSAPDYSKVFNMVPYAKLMAKIEVMKKLEGR